MNFIISSSKSRTKGECLKMWNIKNTFSQNADYGPQPYVVNIDSAASNNRNFRTALWTGKYMQLTLMSIADEIGLEMHDDTDQFFRIEEGHGMVMMGKSKNNLNFQAKVNDDYTIFVPAGTWHNIINLGDEPLKLYTIYAPPHHPHGTVHGTRKEAEKAEHSH